MLLGNSGGGSLMGAYHSQSVEPNIRPARGRTVLAAALDAARRDLFVFVAAHPGRPEVLTDWMDPSVIDEADADVASTRRSTRSTRGPPYDAEFVDPLPRRPARPQRPHHGVVPRRARPARGRRHRRPAVHDDADVGRPADDGRRARPVGPPDAVVLPRRPAAGQRRRVRHRRASARAAAGSTCGASPTPTAAAARTSPASTCRRWSCNRRPTTACSRRRPQEIFDAIAADDKQLEHDRRRPLLPGAGRRPRRGRRPHRGVGRRALTSATRSDGMSEPSRSPTASSRPSRPATSTPSRALRPRRRDLAQHRRARAVAGRQPAHAGVGHAQPAGPRATRRSGARRPTTGSCSSTCSSRPTGPAAASRCRRASSAHRRDGRITRLDEYLDSAAVAALVE